MDVDSQPTMEETILVGDNLMMGPPSPVIPQEIASHINDIEPFCQDELALYRQCAEKRLMNVHILASEVIGLEEKHSDFYFIPLNIFLYKAVDTGVKLLLSSARLK
ncbi:hypothetical protein GOBAR_DD24219 [Gossypium barbadense]|nr:hypothetical protein GOBAR_DD24219 [Gossypium barbadense]